MEKPLKSSVSPTPNRKPVQPRAPLGYGAFLDDNEGPPKNSQAASRPPTQQGVGVLINVGPAGYTKEEIATIRYVYL